MRTALAATAALALLAACMAPPSSEPARRGADTEPPAATATKPPLPKPPLPPGVTRNPDGSVTIREPRCPNCSPWGF